MKETGFWIIKCRSCGKWGSKEIRTNLRGKRFRCFGCGKSHLILKKNEPGLQLHCYEDRPFDNVNFVSSKVLELNGARKCA